jgi:hypothetical protein
MVTMATSFKRVDLTDTIVFDHPGDEKTPTLSLGARLQPLGWRSLTKVPWMTYVRRVINWLNKKKGAQTDPGGGRPLQGPLPEMLWNAKTHTFILTT